MPDQIFLISALWVDTLENSVHKACGYKVIGYCNNVAILDELREVTVDVSLYPWPLKYCGQGGAPGFVPKFKIQPLELIDDASKFVNYRL